jgi:SAM-dependent methyltransferase
MKNVLHVGCGQKTIKSMGHGFNDGTWSEVRLDIDRNVRPDVLGTITDMKAVANNSMDALWSSHNIEHVFFHEVPQVLSEFRRVLTPEGFCVITCPDIEEVCKRVASTSITEVLYESPAGPITPLDILYGHIDSVRQGAVYMAHKTGLSLQLLGERLRQAGFRRLVGKRRPQYLDLWFIAFKEQVDDNTARKAFYRYTNIPYGQVSSDPARP